MATQKTGLNSAYRKALNDRQDNRRFLVIGVVLGILLLLPVFFGHERSQPVEIVDDSEVIAAMSDAEQVHPLTAYARGALDVEARYARQHAESNASGR
jgi:hypothetical protein